MLHNSNYTLTNASKCPSNGLGGAGIVANHFCLLMFFLFFPALKQQQGFHVRAPLLSSTFVFLPNGHMVPPTAKAAGQKYIGGETTRLLASF